MYACREYPVPTAFVETDPFPVSQLRVKLLGESPRHVRPLSETKAIESGANFLSEGVSQRIERAFARAVWLDR